MKKLLAIILVLCLVFSMIPGVLAAGIKGERAMKSPLLPKDALTRKVSEQKMKSVKDEGETETHVLYQDFESGLGEWQILDADEDGYNWQLEFSTAFEGFYSLASYSWYSGSALKPENWLISPKFTPADDMELSWYVTAIDLDYSNEFYSVYLSTTGTDIEDFDVLLYEGTTTGIWKRMAVDLSAYSGQEIYIAFCHHNSTDEYAIALDLIVVDEKLEITPNEELTAAVDGGSGFTFYDLGAYPWAVYTEGETSYAYSTNQGKNNSESSFMTTVELEEGQILTFDYKVSSEKSFDELVFLVNNRVVFQASGIMEDWNTYKYIVHEAGTYELIWSYMKDSSGSEGTDTAYIDNIKIAGQANHNIGEAINYEGVNLEYVNDGEYKWLVDEIDGRSAASNSNQGIHDSECGFSTTVELTPNDMFAFDVKVSSEAFCDGLVLLINGEPVWSISGISDWETVVFVNDTENTETYEFTFIYVKDESYSAGLDSAWIDNVFAGAKPALAGIEFEEWSGKIPVGFSKQVNVLPIPKYADLSEITFSSSNTEVATVDENGFVTALAEGEAIITAESEEGFKATTTVNAYGSRFAIGSTVWNEDDTKTGWNVFDLENNTFEILAENYDLPSTYAMTLVNGSYYGVTIENQLIVIDAKTFEYTITDYSLAKDDIIMLALTYIAKTGEFIGLGIDYSDDNMYLYSVDFRNSDIQTITKIYTDETLLTLAADLEGRLYSIAADTGKLYQIGRRSGGLKLLGNTGVSPMYVQSMAFDHNTGELFWAMLQDPDPAVCIRNGFSMYNGVLVKVNIETAELEYLIDNVGAVVGLSIPYEYPEVEEVPVTGISLKNRFEWVNWGEQLALEANVIPENATVWRILFESDNEDVAVVDKNGVVTVVGRGVANITATTLDGGFKKTCTIYSSYDMQYHLQEDFEGEDLDGWEIFDQDEDGYAWTVQEGNEFFSPVSGTHFITSASYLNYVGALTPDNWLVSPVFTVQEGYMLSWYDVAVDPNYADDNYSVYISILGERGSLTEDFTIELYNGVPTGEWTKHRVDLSEYAGKEVRIAFRHHNVTDEYKLALDLIEITHVDTSTPQIGDANMDDKFNTGDAVILLRSIVGNVTLDDQQKFLAEMNGDDTLNTGDAAIMLLILATK